MEKMQISIVFQPCENGVRFVASLKQAAYRLLEASYSSHRSIAHISICNLLLSEREVDVIVRRLREGLKYEHSQHVYFDRFASYPSSGTLYMAPTVYARNFLKGKIRKIAEEIRQVVPVRPSADPHLTIGRGLEKDDLERLTNAAVFQQIDFDFFCNGILLRKFNPEKKYYEPLLEIPFGGEERPDAAGGQLALPFT